jgi:hypothetical protein
MQASNANAAHSRSVIMKILVRSWEYSYPAATAGVRAAIGTLVILIGVILCVTGFWWGALLMLVGALTMMVAGLMFALVTRAA